MTVSEGMFYHNVLTDKAFREMQGGRFAYAVNKNANKLMTALRESQRKSDFDPDKANEYNDKRDKLQLEYCAKDEEGNPVVDDHGNYEGLLDNEEFEAALEAINEEYKDVEETHIAWQKSDLKVDIHKISIDDLPSTINANQVQLIEFMIKEN